MILTIYILIAISITVLGTLALQKRLGADKANRLAVKIGMLWPFIVGYKIYRKFKRK